MLKKDSTKFEKAQKRGAEMIYWLYMMFDNEKPKDLTLFNLSKRRLKGYLIAGIIS